MLSAFRNASKSKIGTAIMVLIGLMVLIGFAMGDIQNVMQGGSFGGGGNGTLVKVGSDRLTDRDMTRAMERRLSQVRQQNPEADYSAIAGDFDQLLAALVDSKTIEEFARKFGFVLSKRLVDAQIATIPAARGLSGQFSDQAYQAFLQQQRITDEEVRMVLRDGLLQQLLLAPVAVNARVPVGVATPYASVLLETREGQMAFVPTAPFRAGLNPTPADLQRFYEANRARYMIPEQRVLRIAKIGLEQVGQVQPTDKEIADYYNANRAVYAPSETRVISQAVVPDQAVAQAIAQRARGGQSFSAAAAPANISAADLALGEQTKAQFTDTAGAQVANAAFSAAQGAIVGPIRSEFGWHVVRIDEIKRQGGKTLEAARAEIAAKLAGEKRKEAIEAKVDQVQNAIDGGASFTEAAAAAKLTPVETPLITATGTSRADPAYRLPADLTPALKTGFELAENDEPVVESLPNDGGYLLVAPGRVVAAAPAPLAGIREQVTQDWITYEARRRAQQVARTIETRSARLPMTEAVKGMPGPAPQVGPVSARRLQLAQFQGRVPAPLRVLFSLAQGKSRMVASGEGADQEGFFVVRLNKIIPGNALMQPGLIASTQSQMQRTVSQEYGQQFVNAARALVGVKRNEKAIAETKARITGADGS
jgi:peptidyl-prolyl cis-trans isomerase D